MATTSRLIGEIAVLEGASAAYAVYLGGDGLLGGQSVTFTLDTDAIAVPGPATEGPDYSALVVANLLRADGITLTNVFTDPVTKAVTVTATNSNAFALAAGSQVLSFVVATKVDALAETIETYRATLSSNSTLVETNAAVVETQILNVGGLIATSTTPAQWIEINCRAGQRNLLEHIVTDQRNRCIYIHIRIFIFPSKQG